MSSDTTVIVCKTNGNCGKEYRVACLQNAEDLTANANYPAYRPRLNREWALRAFAGAQVFTNPDAAWQEAIRIAEQVWDLEHGIVLKDFSDIYFPATDEKRAARRRRRGRGRLPPQISAPPSQRNEIIEAEFIELENL